MFKNMEKHVNKLIWVTFRKEGSQYLVALDDPKIGNR